MLFKAIINSVDSSNFKMLLTHFIVNDGFVSF